MLETQIPPNQVVKSYFFPKEMEKATKHIHKKVVLAYINAILFLSSGSS